METNNTAYLVQDILPKLQAMQLNIAGMCLPGTSFEVEFRIFNDGVTLITVDSIINGKLILFGDGSMNYINVCSFEEKGGIDKFLLEVTEKAYNKIVEQFNSQNK